MAQVEKPYERMLCNKLLAMGWWVRKLHGNIYQSGLPDLLLCRPDGELMLIEMKGTKASTLKYPEIQIIEKLDGPQVGNIIMLNKKRAKVAVLLGSPVGWFLAKSPFRPQEERYAITFDELIEVLTKW